MRCSLAGIGIGGGSARCRARSAMSSARSAMRSRSVLILSAGGDAAQVDGHRLVQGQDLEALFLDVVLLAGRSASSPSMTSLGQVGVALLQGADRLVDRLLDRGRQRQQVALQVLQIALQVLGHRVPSVRRVRWRSRRICDRDCSQPNRPGDVVFGLLLAAAA